MKKATKQQLNDKQIIAGMTAIDKSVRTMDAYGQKFNNWIDRAALSGDDANAKRLIARKIKVYQFIKQLEGLKVVVEEGVFTAKAIGQLGELPDAIRSCVAVTNAAPDFSKLGKNINKLFAGIEEAQDQIGKLTEILTPKQEEQYEIDLRITGADTKNAYEDTPEFKAEYEAMMDRIKPSIGTPVTAPNDNVAPTGALDIDGLIGQINKETK